MSAVKGGSFARAFAGGFHGTGRKSLGRIIVDSECWDIPALPRRSILLLAGCPGAREGWRGQTSLQKKWALPAVFLTLLPCVPGFFSFARRLGLPWLGSIVGHLAEVYPAAEREFGCFSSCRLCSLHGRNIREGREAGGQGARCAAWQPQGPVTAAALMGCTPGGDKQITKAV